VMVIGVLFGGVLLCFPVTQITDAFEAAFQADSAEPVDAWQRQQRIAVFARLYQLAWGGGLVAALIGLIAMLSDLSDPASIGAGMAVALLAPAYGALLAEFIFNPMQQMVMNQPPRQDGPSEPGQREPNPTPVPPRGQTALFKGVAVIAITVSMFMVPIVSFSEIKKSDALDPVTEAAYLRYLYGDEAVQNELVEQRIDAIAAQYELERVVVYARLRELMSEQSEGVIEDMAIKVLAIPQPEDIDPDATHLWRRNLADRFVEAYYSKYLK
ncbi:MAG: MotA/TolQ/ExbB proton channel family protein, partial [Planctomycetota bacterium]